MLPILLRFGPVTIYSFGFFLFLGFFLFCFVVWKQARIGGMPEEKLLDTLFLTVFLAMIIGRLVYVFSYWEVFSVDFSRIILFFKYPGISLPSFLLSALIVAGLSAKNYNLPVLWVWDVFAFAGAFLAVFGNIGCFLDGCFLLSTYLPLILAALALFLLTVFVLITRKFSTNSELAEVVKKRGMFFLCYLIFQLLSLLMTTWYTRNFWRIGIYLGGLGVVTSILLVRYKLLFKYVYRAISQRRSKPSKDLS